MPNASNTYPPYKAPAVMPEAVWLFNSLCIRQSPWNFSVGRAACTAELLPVPAEFAPACSVDFSLDHLPCTAELSDAAFLRYHEAFAEEAGEKDVPETLALLPDEVRRAVLLSLAAPVLQGMGNALGAAVSIGEATLAPQPGDGKEMALGFRLRFSQGGGEEVLFACIRLHSLRRLSLLGEKFRALPVRTKGFLTGNARSIPLQAGFEAGHVSLSAAEAKGLAPDDVLIPEEWTWPQSVRVCIWHGNGRRLSSACHVENGIATLTSSLLEDAIMENSEPKELELRLTFELEQRLITLAELEALAEGYTFALKCDNESPVTVRANGVPLAQGRIVDINGTLGVQITRTL